MSASAISAPRPAPHGILGSLNPANVSAGLSVILIYLAAPIPFYLAAMTAFPDREVALAGLFVTFVTAGVFTIVACLVTREPIALGWSMPALIYLAAGAAGHSMAELAGACLVAGVGLLFIAVTGLAERIARAIPGPVVMAVLAGSAIEYCTGAVSSLETGFLAAGAPIAGFFIARGLGKTWFPPIAGAMIFGLPAALLGPGAQSAPLEIGFPSLQPLVPAFSFGAVAGLAPLLAIAAVVGNIQGQSILKLEGYRPRETFVATATGIMSVIHALFAAPPGTMQRVSLAVFAGSEAGPRDTRYISAIIASVGAILIAFAVVPLSAWVDVLPQGFTSALVGLVMLSVVLEALQRAMTGNAVHGAFIAFVVTASGVTLLDIGSTLWGLVAGIVALHLAARAAPPTATAEPEKR